MQPPFEFDSAWRAEQVDFVSLLSAEQGCDVCHELHASVDELRCAICEAAICPDCVRLRPDTSWACARCYERHPLRVFAPRRARAELLLRAKQGVVALRGRSRQGLRLARAHARTLTTRVRPWWLALHAMIALRVRAVQDRWPTWRAQLVQYGQLAAWLSWRVTLRGVEHAHAVAHVLKRQAVVQGRMARVVARRLLEHGRVRVAQAWLSVRSVPVRHHATALLMATLLLYAVARAEHRDA